MSEPNNPLFRRTIRDSVTVYKTGEYGTFELEGSQEIVMAHAEFDDHIKRYLPEMFIHALRDIRVAYHPCKLEDAKIIYSAITNKQTVGEEIVGEAWDSRGEHGR
jgi:hypothetical protein